MHAPRIVGRSWLRGEVSLEEIRRLVNPFGDQAATLFSDDAMEGCRYDIVVVDGPLRTGSMDTFKDGLVGLVVRGALHVETLYEDTDDPNTGVYVVGDMRAGNVITTGALGVTGSLVVEGALVGSHNDFSAHVLGDVRAAAFFPGGHYFEIGGTLTALLIADHEAKYRVPQRLRKALVPIAPKDYRATLNTAILDPGDDDGTPPRLDNERVCQRVRKGLSLVIEGAPVLPATAKKTPAKKSPAKKSPAKKSPAKKGPEKKMPGEFRRGRRPGRPR